MIPAEAIDAAWEQARADADGYPYPERDEIRRILEAAAPHMLEHFANRIDWRCVDCEDPVGPGKALKLLKEASE